MNVFVRSVATLFAMAIVFTTSPPAIAQSSSAKAGPVRLVCLTPDALREHVRRLTRQQIVGIRAAARNRQVKSPCDDVQLPVGTVVIHQRYVRTKDNWWILGQTIQYPNGSILVTVDPTKFAQVLQRIPYPDDDRRKRHRHDRDRKHDRDRDEGRSSGGRKDAGQCATMRDLGQRLPPECR